MSVGTNVVASAGLVTGLSGSGIMSGLASYGALVGGGAVAGMVVLSAAPGLTSVAIMNRIKQVMKPGISGIGGDHANVHTRGNDALSIVPGAVSWWHSLPSCDGELHGQTTESGSPGESHPGLPRIWA